MNKLLIHTVVSIARSRLEIRNFARSIAAGLGFIACMTAMATSLSAQSCQGGLPDPQPICIDVQNNRYFHFNGKTTRLVGASGEYLPHVDTQNRQFSASQPSANPANQLISTGYCTFATVTSDTSTTIKAERCVDQLAANNLNLMRLWVSLNSSAGSDKTGSPYLHEQPFTLDSNSLWDFNITTPPPTLVTPDTAFLSNLVSLVSYAQSKGVVVEVTLFDPWSAEQANGNADPFSPYLSGNNSIGKQFTNNAFFVEGETNCSPALPTYVDCAADNKQLRRRQVAVLQAVVQQLYNFNNVYYELANEADFTNAAQASEANFLSWQRYMADQIASVEAGLTPPRHHLIAANYLGKSIIDSTAQMPSDSGGGLISIINGHYARLNKPNDPVPQYSAIDLVRHYNVADGSSGVPNNMIYGFNESKITGYHQANAGSFFNSVDAMRAEAWEFLLDGGGAYDLLAYDWGNVGGCSNDITPRVGAPPNNCDSTEGIRELGLLSKAMNVANSIMPPNPATMTRMDSRTPWIDVPTYGALDPGGASNMYWAAMQNTVNRWLLYIHHSTVPAGTTTGFFQYQPVMSTYSRTFHVFNLTTRCTSAGRFQADWYDPKSMNLVASNQFNWPVNASVALPSAPSYSFDVLLVVSWVSCL